jgi:hypothetical protein
VQHGRAGGRIATQLCLHWRLRLADAFTYGYLYTYPDGNSSIIADAQRNTHSFTYTHGNTYSDGDTHAHSNTNRLSLRAIHNEHRHRRDLAGDDRHRQPLR